MGELIAVIILTGIYVLWLITLILIILEITDE